MSFEDLARAYRSAEASFLPKVAGDRFLTLEVKRRVSELMLYSATEKLCAFELCQSLFEGVSQLGLSNLEKKSSVYLIYARYCLQIGHPKEGKQLLERLEAELKHELQRSDALVYRQLLQMTLDVLQQLKG